VAAPACTRALAGVSLLAMTPLLLVCLGSALGGGLRYLVSLAAPRVLGTAFPFATLIVNATGSFVIALVTELALHTHAVTPAVRLFLTTGVMGGLTTYSTFNYETLLFLREGPRRTAVLNVLFTVLGCLAAGALGMACAAGIAHAR
jgi:CrcB protein